jgi:hypothetical protein
MPRIPADDRLLELDDGRTVGYAAWGDPEGSPVFIGHGTPGSRLDRYAPLDDPNYEALRLRLENAHAAVEAAVVEARRRVRLNEGPTG